MLNKFKEMLAGTAGNIVGAIILLVAGIFVIRFVMKRLRKLKSFEKLDQTLTRFILNNLKFFVTTPTICPASLPGSCSAYSKTGRAISGLVATTVSLCFAPHFST